MRKKYLWNYLFLAALFVLMLAAEATAIVKLYRLDMLPPVYLMILAAILAVFSLAIGLLAFLGIHRPAKTRRIIAAVLAVLLLCGSVAIATVAGDVMNTLEAMTRDFLDIPTREVYVLADDPAQELEASSSLGMKPLQAVWYFKEGTLHRIKPMEGYIHLKTPMDVLHHI
ncbi:MAG: hypothetical protein II311_08400 [Lachnospiraceae bacterium]|nr:hypothetical protein [Lachnospiraceae bacterium]